jgi:hypothetical protein
MNPWPRRRSPSRRGTLSPTDCDAKAELLKCGCPCAFNPEIDIGLTQPVTSQPPVWQELPMPARGSAKSRRTGQFWGARNRSMPFALPRSPVLHAVDEQFGRLLEVFVGTNRMWGRETASQITAVSLALFFLRVRPCAVA